MGEAAFKLTPEAEEVSTRALSIPDQAKALKVITTEDYIKAGDLWKRIKELRDKVAETFNPIIQKAHEAHKEALAKKAEVDRPLEGAQKTVKALMEEYDREQERIRLAEERRLQEEQRKREEEERLAAAIEAEQAGQEEVAEEIMSAPVQAAPVVLPKATPKLQGGPVFRTVWKFRIKNPAIIPHEYMKPDEVKIGGVVRALKKSTNIPGIEVYEERV